MVPLPDLRGFRNTLLVVCRSLAPGIGRGIHLVGRSEVSRKVLKSSKVSSKVSSMHLVRPLKALVNKASNVLHGNELIVKRGIAARDEERLLLKVVAVVVTLVVKLVVVKLAITLAAARDEERLLLKVVALALLHRHWSNYSLPMEIIIYR